MGQQHSGTLSSTERDSCDLQHTTAFNGGFEVPTKAFAKIPKGCGYVHVHWSQIC